MNVRLVFYPLMVALALAFWGGAQITLPFYEDFEGPPTNWTIGGLWNFVSQDDLARDPRNPAPFPSPTTAAYFGQVDPDTGKGSYNFGQVIGSLVSPKIGIPSGVTHVKVEFRYFRQVEYYAGGEYDITTVEYSLDDGNNWKPLWKKTSKDPSVLAWESFASGPIPVNGSTSFKLRFTFDSRDAYANDFLGWLIDDVRVTAVPKPLAIKTESLPQGRYGTSYEVQLQAEGGTPEYSWSIGSGRLPLRLELDPRTGIISGIPEEVGTFPVEIVVMDGRGERASKRFHLAIVSAAESVFYENFETDFWTDRTGLWHRTNEVKGVDLGEMGYVAYYGKDDATNPNYNEGKRTRGTLTSPEEGVTGYRGMKVVVSFKSWRGVETYAQPYDKTWVELILKGTTKDNPWTKTWVIWSKDSRDPSEKAWIYVEVNTGIVVPTDAEKIQIRFCFDSVDAFANNYVGWLVDEISIGFVPDVLRIKTESLPTGEAGIPYEVELKAEGGKPPYTWTSETALPDGLILVRDTGVLYGTPRQAGRYQVDIKVTDADGASATQSFLLLIEEPTTLFFDDFSERLDENWLTQDLGLWHWTEGVTGVDLTGRDGVAYYGKDDNTSPNYNTGARTFGYLTSKPFAVSGVTYVKVEFDSWRWVEAYAGAYDKTFVQIRFEVSSAWTTWTTVWYRDSSHPSEKKWLSVSTDGISVPAGATNMQIRFVFDSVDKWNNTYTGWLIDNVKVRKTTSGGTQSLTIPTATPRDQITVMNIPNPVRDVHTTTFLVRGVEADLIRVEIYDLTGRLVYVGEAPGNELVWHTQDMLGQYLANGVYLYKVYVKVGDTWLVSDVRKLVILR